MMNCPACGFAYSSGQQECPRCGLIFARYRKSDRPAEDKMLNLTPPVPRGDVSHDDNEDSLFNSIFLYVKPRADQVDLVMRALCAMIFLFWGLMLMFTARDGEGGGFGFWHMVNLPFHEAGHLVFRPFGHLVMSMGGTLGQLLMPLICMGVLLIKTRDTFGAGFCLWWLAVNFMDLAPYIGDARSLTLPLLGGNTGESSPYGFHDWEYILTETGLLNYDQALANMAFATGVILMAVAYVWWFFVLRKYSVNLDS